MDYQFEAELISEVPGNSEVRRFAAAGKRHATDGALIRVSAADRSWVGVFSRGESNYAGFAQLEGGRLIVVSMGAAYVVNAHEPDEWWVLPSPFYTFVSVASDAQTAILIDPWRVQLIGPKGVLWSNEPDSDGIEFIDERDGIIRVRASIVGNGNRELAIYTSSGEISEAKAL